MVVRRHLSLGSCPCQPSASASVALRVRRRDTGRENMLSMTPAAISQNPCVSKAPLDIKKPFQNFELTPINENLQNKGGFE